MGSGFNSGSSAFGLGLERLFSLSISIGLGGSVGLFSASGYYSIANGFATGCHFGFSSCEDVVGVFLGLTDIFAGLSYGSKGTI